MNEKGWIRRICTVLLIIIILIISSSDSMIQANSLQSQTSQEWLKDAINICKKNAPAYFAEYWNWLWWINDSTNCYAYAFDMSSDPRSGKLFSKDFGLQPGMFSRRKYNPKLCDDTEKTNELFVDTITADMHSIGYSFIEATQNTKIPQNSYMVALAISPKYYKYEDDYHWYRLNPDGTWSHKPGTNNVTNLDESGNIITDPQIANRGYYDDFIGYFYVIR